MNVVVMASGEGTNLQALIDYCKLELLPINLVCVFSNCPDAMCLKRANINNIPTECLEYNKKTQTRDDYDSLIVDIINKYSPDLVLMLGYMRIVTPTFIRSFPNILNLHPALPGELPGNNAIEAAYNKFQKGLIHETGVMVHRVIEEIDAGEVIDSVKVPIMTNDTYEELRTRVRNAEKPLLIGALMKYIMNSKYEKSLPVPVSEQGQDSRIISGKVRDRFDIGYGLLCFHHSDRLSSFDRHICHIKGKGTLLNMINEWWMNKTRHIIDNHFLYSRGKYLVAKKCTTIPLEIIVRGYITGSTSTSLWTHYNNGVRNYCGIDFPDGLIKNQKLDEPVLTPTTKGETDELISYQEILNRNIVSEEELDYIYSKARELFKFGSEYVDNKGLILVDTKYEFGRDSNGNIILIDEIHTCDSSRFWLQSTYNERFLKREEPEKLDKDAARDYVKSICDPYTVDTIPEIPEERKLKVLSCYQRLYKLLTDYEYQDCSNEGNGNEIIEMDINKNSTIDYYFRNYHSPLVVIFSGSPSDEWYIEKLRAAFLKQDIYSAEHVCSAHKKTAELLAILQHYNSFRKFNRKLIFITVAGRSNALSGVVACNTSYPVIASPPFSDKMDMTVNINSTIQMPSNVPTMTILEPSNIALSCKRIFELSNL